jgi:rhodanese-related sulfurtransferase/DNA-binding MarR family transcriptional regulator
MQTRLYREFERIGKALASRRRLEMLDVLAQGERTVQAVANRTGLSVANASHHLRRLLDARLVEVRHEGREAHYRLASPSVFELWRTLRSVAEERLAEVDRVVAEYQDDRHRLSAVSLAELRERYHRGEVVLIDVRPEEEYQAGHIRGAESIPLERIEELLDRLPEDRQIVAYCRGPYCLLSDEAVERLRDSGFEAHRLEIGYPEWKAEGLPVAGEGPNDASVPDGRRRALA